MKIAVWGTGYIGLSTMLYYAKNEVKSIGIDINPSKVDNINRGICPIPNLEKWTGIKLKPYVDELYISATTDFNEAKNADVHFIAVNTEKSGAPYYDSLKDVANKISSFNRDSLVVIESTLAPGVTDRYVLPKLNKVCVAPRRDWFTLEYQQKLDIMPRIYGANSENVADEAEEILSIVCKNLIRAPDYRYAEIVKSVENMLRHVHCVVAQQLAFAYPHLDVNKILELAGTKWNVERYYSSIRTSGYCIPLSSSYVLEGAKYPERLTILKEVIKQENITTSTVISDIIERLNKYNSNSVAILSVSYLGDVPVDVLSPTKFIAPALIKNNVKVGIHDPYFDDSYIKSEYNAIPIRFPDDLVNYDAVVIIANHSAYDVPFNLLKKYLRKTKFIIDNHGIWQKFAEKFKEIGIVYHRIGDSGWLFGEEINYEYMHTCKQLGR